MGVSLTGAERMRVLVLVLVANGAGRELLDGLLGLLDHEGESLLLSDILLYRYFFFPCEWHLNLSRHWLRIGHGFVYGERFNLRECDISRHFPHEFFIDIFHYESGYLAHFIHLNNERYLDHFDDLIRLGHHDDHVFIEQYWCLCYDGRFAFNLHGAGCEHLDGLEHL